MSRSVAVGKGRIIMLNDIKEENVLFTFFVVTLMIMIYLIFYNFNILDYGYLLCLIFCFIKFLIVKYLNIY